MMFTKAYWTDLVGRSIRTFAQTLVALWGAGQFNLLSVDWAQSFGVAGGAAVLSVLMSIAAPGPVGGRTLTGEFVGGLPPHPLDGDELQQAIADEQYRRIAQGRHRREP